MTTPRFESLTPPAGSHGPLGFAFPLLDEADLVVTRAGVRLTLGADYTVEIAEDAQSAAVTLVEEASGSEVFEVFGLRTPALTTNYAAFQKLTSAGLNVAAMMRQIEMIEARRDIDQALELIAEGGGGGGGAVASVNGQTGAVVLTKSHVGLGNVENKSSATIRGELSSGNVIGALGFTPAAVGSVGAIASVNGKTGIVNLDKGDLGLGSVENKSSATIRGELTSGNVTGALGFTPAAEGAVGAIASVAGKTGTVVLDKGDVGLGNVENKSSATIRSELTGLNVTAALGFTPANVSALALKLAGPANNTADYVPMWDGADSKTLKNGRPIGAGAANALLDRDAGDGRYAKLNGSAYAVTVSNIANTDIANFGAIAEMQAFATVTPDEAGGTVVSFGNGRAGQVVVFAATQNVAIACDGVKIKGNRNARAAGRQEYGMNADDTAIAICEGGDVWRFCPLHSEINRLLWSNAGSGAEPGQAYTTVGALGKRRQESGGWPGDLPWGSTIFMKDEGTHKIQAGGMRRVHFGDSAAMISIVGGVDGDGYPCQPARFTDASNWDGLICLVQDAGWYGGKPFLPGATQLLTLGDGWPGSIAQGIASRFFHMPTAKAGPTSTPGGFQVHTCPPNTLTPMLAEMTHDNGNNINWGPTRYEFSVDKGEFTYAYPQNYGAPLLTGPILDADFTHTAQPAYLDARWQQFKGHANYTAIVADLTVPGLSNYNGGVALVNPFNRYEAVVWGRVGHTRGSPGGGYYAQVLRKVADRSTQIFLETIDPATGAKNLPAQPRFAAYRSSDVNNVTGNGTHYTLLFNAERYDIGGVFNTGNGKFTAPVTGFYDVRTQVQLGGVLASATRVSLILGVYAADNSLRYLYQKDGGDLPADSAGHVSIDIAATLDMYATDYVKVVVVVEGNGADTVDVLHGDAGSGIYQSYLQGRLVA